MQRRAAAMYFAFFLVVGVAAFGFLNVAGAQKPAYQLDAPSFEADETTTVGGTTYTVSEVGSSGGGGSLEATITWTNTSVPASETLDNGSTVTYEGDDYRVHIENSSDVSEFTLVETFDLAARLQNDSNYENESVTVDGTDYVVPRENATLVPVEAYLPEPRTHTFAEGETFPYDGTDTTVDAVEPAAVTLTWTTSADREATVTEGGNVTLGGQQHFAHFPTGHSVQLVPTSQYDQYATTGDRRDYFDERMNGLWGVTIFSGIAATLVLAGSYLPNRG